jgi:hypothetical protein
VIARRPREAAPSPASAAPGLTAHQRRLVQVAALGVLAHALFLPISVAGMQIGLAFSVGALVLLRLTGRRAWAHSPLDLPCLAMCGAAVASLGLGALAGSPPVGWFEATLWRSLLSPIIVLSAIEAARDGPGEGASCRRLALAALGVWAAASLLPSAIAWAQHWTGIDPLHVLGLREKAVTAKVPIYPDRFAAVGFFKWYQRLAHNLLPPLCLACAVAMHGKVSRRLRALLGLAVLAAAAAVVLTLSRAAWASLVLAVLVVAVLGVRTRRWALPLALACSAAMMLHPGVRVRLSHLGAPGINDDRRAIWSVCRSAVEERPLTGVGWGNLPRRTAGHYDRLAATYPAPLPRAWCHNSFFTAWAEGGPLLFAALVAYWALLFRAFWFWRRRRDDDLSSAAAIGALAALVTMLASSLAHDIFYSSEATYGLGFAIAVAAALARSGPAGHSGKTREVGRADR